MNDDGGLQDAEDALRARREAADVARRKAEREAAEERAAENQADEEARDRLRAAGLAFARRARSAGIAPNTVHVRTGSHERTRLFSREMRQVPVYERRAAWVVWSYSVTRGGYSDGYTDRLNPGIYVLEDGTVIYGSLKDPWSVPRDRVPNLIEALASYLVGTET